MMSLPMMIVISATLMIVSVMMMMIVRGMMMMIYTYIRRVCLFISMIMQTLMSKVFKLFDVMSGS